MVDEKKTKPQVEEVEAKVKSEAPSQESRPGQSDNSDNFALASLIFGILGLCASFCAGLCGSPFALIGLILGVMGMKSEKNKTMAIVGIVLSALGLITGIVMMIIGVAINLSDLSY